MHFLCKKSSISIVNNSVNINLPKKVNRTFFAYNWCIYRFPGLFWGFIFRPPKRGATYPQGKSTHRHYITFILCHVNYVYTKFHVNPSGTLKFGAKTLSDWTNSHRGVFSHFFNFYPHFCQKQQKIHITKTGSNDFL